MVELERPAAGARPARAATIAARSRRWAPGLAVVVGLLLAAGGAWVLRRSPFPPNGYGGDEGFRLASVLRDARHLFPSDFAYKGLPAFYPPLYFFVLGRAVAVTGIAPYEALKLGTLAVALVVPLVGYGLWRKVTGDAAMAVGVVVAGLAVTGWFEPYSWIAAVAFVPWWCAYVVRVDGAEVALTRREVTIGALIGGVLLMTFYYPFFVGGVQLGAVLVAGSFARARGRPVRLRVTRQSWSVLAGSLLVSAAYWVPMVVGALTTGTFTSLQNRYFDQWMVAVPLPFLDLSATGVVMLFGLVSIALGCRRSNAMRGLATLLGAAYAWIVFGDVMVLARHAGARGQGGRGGAAHAGSRSWSRRGERAAALVAGASGARGAGGGGHDRAPRRRNRRDPVRRRATIRPRTDRAPPQLRHRHRWSRI